MTKTGTHRACVFNIRYTHKYISTSFHKFTTAQHHTTFPGPGTTHQAKSAADPPQTQNKTKAITVSCCYGSLGVRLKKEDAQEAQWDGSSVLSKTERDWDTDLEEALAHPRMGHLAHLGHRVSQAFDTMMQTLNKGPLHMAANQKRRKKLKHEFPSRSWNCRKLESSIRLRLKTVLKSRPSHTNKAVKINEHITWNLPYNNPHAHHCEKAKNPNFPWT